jgi:mRNA-degrading endonuclease RelE of RelBE toxin-antitoxin system
VPFAIIYTEEAKGLLSELTASDRSLVIDAISAQLMHQPDKETRNRKPMRKNPLALWELRVGKLRVYYDVVAEPDPVVVIRAIGIKIRDQVYIKGKAVKL